MEPCLGGEVWSLLRDRFYTAIGLFASSRYHLQRSQAGESSAYTYGYAKLVDFGFAKKTDIGRKTWTFCGTPEYVAPEIVLNKSHNHAVDLWSLGIFVYELLAGVPPFASSDPMKNVPIQHDPQGYRDALDLPRHISKPGCVLIKKLCRNAPNDRLGCQRDGMKDVRKSRWFDGFDFVALRD